MIYMIKTKSFEIIQLYTTVQIITKRMIFIVCMYVCIRGEP
jgi:hypothetical protein